MEPCLTLSLDFRSSDFSSFMLEEETLKDSFLFCFQNTQSSVSLNKFRPVIYFKFSEDIIDDKSTQINFHFHCKFRLVQHFSTLGVVQISQLGSHQGYQLLVCYFQPWTIIFSECDIDATVFFLIQQFLGFIFCLLSFFFWLYAIL